MKHPYLILVENLEKYSSVLKKDDILQAKNNSFYVDDKDFKVKEFINDVIKETGIKPLEHSYIGASCADPTSCFKPYKVIGFDNVLFYFKNKDMF